MTPQKHARAKTVFLAAIESPQAGRDALIAEQCAGDEELERQVRGLLAAHSVETLPPPRIPRSLLSPNQPRLSAPEDSTAALATRARTRPAATSKAHREFPPGTVIDDRYRIVALVGSGGMGQVYRADDLTLDQQVALKFLPEEWSGDPRWIALLRNEAKLARTVTHPNVCRIHDLCEWKGEYFLSMEYVDGENLATLLRRIGRLPVDKAAEVARQTCLGLAVAHNAQVLHRDLKPANIMLDSRGQVRITDFGIAAVAKSVSGLDIRTGTAAYMAPEQIAGREVTARSDLYALGLVIYEVFTGRPAFRADSVADYLELHEHGTVTLPSEHTPTIPREVERVIMACLRKDPRERPSSALMVAAAMPGSDVLADALEADLTPAPELVAAARARTNEWRAPLGAWGVLTVTLLALVIFVRAYSAQPWDHLGSLSPRVLEDRAKSLLSSLGAVDLVSSTSGYCEGVDCFAPWNPFLAADEVTADAFTSGVSGPQFWFRTGKRLEASSVESILFGPGRVTIGDPPPHAPGMATVVLDLSGRLLLYSRVSGRTGSGQSHSESFTTLLRASEVVDPTQLRIDIPTAASIHPPRLIWRAAQGDTNGSAALALGSADETGPTFFAIAREPNAARPPPRMELRNVFAKGGLLMLFVTMAVIALPLAWHGFRTGRLDGVGAMALASFLLIVDLMVEGLRLGVTSTFIGTMLLLAAGVIRALGMAALFAVFYVVVDLYARRHWPSILITWNRVIRWKFADPDVRRHVSIGVVVGCFWALLKALERPATELLGWQAVPILVSNRIEEKLHGVRDAVASYLTSIPQAIGIALMVLMILVAVRMVTRGPRSAVIITGLLLTPVFVARGVHPLTAVVFFGLGGVLVCMWLLTRVGLLSLAVALLVVSILNTTPITTSLSAWYADLTLFGIGLVLALAAMQFDFASRLSRSSVPRSNA